MPEEPNRCEEIAAILLTAPGGVAELHLCDEFSLTFDNNLLTEEEDYLVWEA